MYIRRDGSIRIQCISFVIEISLRFLQLLKISKFLVKCYMFIDKDYNTIYLIPFILMHRRALEEIKLH